MTQKNSSKIRVEPDVHSVTRYGKTMTLSKMKEKDEKPEREKDRDNDRDRELGGAKSSNIFGYKRGDWTDA